MTTPSMSMSKSTSSGGDTLINEPLSPSASGFSATPEQVDAMNHTVPPTHASRTLVLCFDGTGDQFDNDNSNVVLFFSMLKKDDRKQQMVYYQTGIGTYTNESIISPIASKVSKTLDSMVAWNLNSHVMSGYEFLMQNYEAGDKICLFGFSRGAYTARALAGMVHKVGLLPACNHQQVPFAYKMFLKTDEAGWKQSTAFKKAFSMDVDIDFIGVWDTVNSVGIIPHRLPFTASNTAVKVFRHAVSLDERRAKFKANLFNRPTKKEQALGTHPGEMPKAGADVVTINTAPNGANGANGAHNKESSLKKKNGNSERKKQRQMEREFSMNDGCHSQETDVLEVWFAGCHCDVGGGSVANETRHNLARIPLRWMVRQCFKTNTGIQFHASLLRSIGMEPATLWPVVQTRPEALTYSSLPHAAQAALIDHVRECSKQPPVSPPVPEESAMPGGYTPVVNVGYAETPLAVGPDGKTALIMSEEEEDLRDALCPIYDQLSLAPSWWFLELFPMRHREQRDDDHWIGNWSLNLGRGRKIPKRIQRRQEFHVHRSVKIRLDAGENLPGGRYTPKARQWEVEPNWVD
ncbi:hypothetical protein NLI96_g2925 [Meripilus lineatus]|uniref:T6SS Phospholipase effector Tle1-like catalytic domain-containing protein n=1 Tax=Meripilus lineatus TaxID=2056292 RepID=A0AAD5V7F7_9APHY|nr:hypothetical protein NLI96_g2925 [Physisporinus lineatus]